MRWRVSQQGSKSGRSRIHSRAPGTDWGQYRKLGFTRKAVLGIAPKHSGFYSRTRELALRIRATR